MICVPAWNWQLHYQNLLPYSLISCVSDRRKNCFEMCLVSPDYIESLWFLNVKKWKTAFALGDSNLTLCGLVMWLLSAVQQFIFESGLCIVKVRTLTWSIQSRSVDWWIHAKPCWSQHWSGIVSIGSGLADKIKVFLRNKVIWIFGSSQKWTTNSGYDLHFDISGFVYRWLWDILNVLGFEKLHIGGYVWKFTIRHIVYFCARPVKL